MKSIIVTITIAALGMFGAASQADARSYRSSGYVNSGYDSYHRPCAVPVQRTRCIIGHDRWGRPIWGYRAVRSHYRPVLRPHYPVHCPPPVHHYNRSGPRGHHGSHR